MRPQQTIDLPALAEMIKQEIKRRRPDATVESRCDDGTHTHVMVNRCYQAVMMIAYGTVTPHDLHVAYGRVLTIEEMATDEVKGMVPGAEQKWQLVDVDPREIAESIAVQLLAGL